MLRCQPLSAPTFQSQEVCTYTNSQLSFKNFEQNALQKQMRSSTLEFAPSQASSANQQIKNTVWQLNNKTIQCN